MKSRSGETEVASSGQPWTGEEVETLIAIAAMVPSRSEAECCLKWTSTTPVWTPQEDMLLATAVRARGKGVWLQVAAMVPGRTMLDCLNRWAVLVEASRNYIYRLPRIIAGG